MSAPCRALILLSACAVLPAQGPGEGAAPPRPATPQPAAVELPETPVPTHPGPAALPHSVTPIHTAPDDPEGGAYGIWGAGAHYKASFHGDFTFVPYLGAGYPHNQPWSWRTTAVERGGEPVADLTAAARKAAPYRYEYRFGGVTEAYDLLPEGAEQTFVLATRPRGSGDLRVIGAVTTALVAAPVAAASQALTFRDQDGTAIVRYGKALAIDAAGRRSPVTTAWDGAAVTLAVPAAFVDIATYPLVIDPLLSRDSIGFWNTGPVGPDGTVTATAIGRDDYYNMPMIAYSRDVSATDSDLWVWLFDTDACLRSERNQVFTDITASWGNESVAIATVGGATVADKKWLVAFVRDFATSRGPRLHVHDLNDTALQTSVIAIPRPSGTKVETIDVGGQNVFNVDDTGFLVFDRNLNGDTDNLAVFGIPYSPSGGFGTEVAISEPLLPQGGTARTNSHPKVNQQSAGSSDGWAVCWQGYWDARTTPDEWDVFVARIDGSGGYVGGRAGQRSVPDTAHQLDPDIAGQDGRYALHYSEWSESPLTKTSSELGGDVFAERLDWPLSGSAIDRGHCEVTRGLVSDRRWRSGGIAHDNNSDDHWCVMLTSTISGAEYTAMIGHDAGVTERVTAFFQSGNFASLGCVTYNDDANYPRGAFQTAFATDEGSAAGGMENHPVYCQGFEHFAEPSPGTHGIGCGGSIGTSGRILRGSDSFAVTLSGAPGTTFAALFLSGGMQPPTPAPFLAPGCFINITQPFADVTVLTSGGGAARVPIPFPACPFLLTGTYHFQWLFLVPGSPLQVGATEGMSITIL